MSSSLARRTSSWQKASRYQRITRPGLKARASYCHRPGTAWQLTRTRQSASVLPLSVLNSYCQKLPPKTAACPLSTTPTPMQPSCASPPPATTVVPSLSPVSAAPLALTRLTTSPHSATGGKISSLRPTFRMMAASHWRFCRSKMPVVHPLLGSVLSTPVSL